VVRERRNRTIKEYIYIYTHTHTQIRKKIKQKKMKDDIPYLVFFPRQIPNGGSEEKDQWMKIGFKLIRVSHATINR
jgi:vacuolar-type H+-ATPase subunit F/Vma7